MNEFKRKFSISMYKNLKINLGSMDFYKDFVNDTRGDLYPIITKIENTEEYIENNTYRLKSGRCERLFCQFFPFASYEITATTDSGEFGFSFHTPNGNASIIADDKKIRFNSGQEVSEIELPCETVNHTLTVSCRPGHFDLYFKKNNKADFFHTFTSEIFNTSNKQSFFSDSYVNVYVSGTVTVTDVSSYIDNGISLADMRPVKYENGDVLQESGKIYFSASIRMQEGTFQGMFSWMPGTAEFDMTGALFYDCGDGVWRGYVAPSIVYNRKDNRWYIWVSSFEHEHILAYASFEGDPRFGVNVADVTIMPKASKTDNITSFAGFTGDEDPDFFFDDQKNKWLMAICRLDPETKQYVYVFFESDSAFDGYKYIGKGYNGAETGGSFVKINGEQYFICGNSFADRSEYRIYSRHGMELANFNYPDGGFRGWGTVIPVKLCGRTRYFLLTFDRHNGSSYKWSYGNVYCFELTF